MSRRALDLIADRLGRTSRKRTDSRRWKYVAVDGWVDFLGAVMSTLVGVLVGSLLTWAFALHLQRRDHEDRYGERLDDRALIWMDELQLFLGKLHDEAFASGSTGVGYYPSGQTWLQYEVFRSRLRQAMLIARRPDLEVLQDIHADLDASLHDSVSGPTFDHEFLVRARMLMAEFGNYRRGELHPSWFAFWNQGTQMPFVPDGYQAMKPAPARNPSARG
jgi:hypothetical protein